MTHHCPYFLNQKFFKIERKYDELVKIYEKMITSKKTEVFLGYRGLMEQNLKIRIITMLFFMVKNF